MAQRPARGQKVWAVGRKQPNGTITRILREEGEVTQVIVTFEDTKDVEFFEPDVFDTWYSAFGGYWSITE